MSDGSQVILKGPPKSTVEKGDRVEAHGKDWFVLSVVAEMKTNDDSEIKVYLCTAVEWREWMPGFTNFNEGFGVPDTVKLIQVFKTEEG